MVNPKDVRSPKSRINGEITVLFTKYDANNSYSFSIARLNWDGKDCLAARWNGAKDNSGDIGNPQSRGLPTWFILHESLYLGIADLLEIEETSNGESIQTKNAASKVRELLSDSSPSLINESALRPIIEKILREKKLI